MVLNKRLAILAVALMAGAVPVVDNAERAGHWQ